MAFDLTADCEATGRFVIVDGYDVAGGGIITAAVADELRRPARRGAHARLQLGRGRRHRRPSAPQRFGHRAALVMFVGKAGIGQAPATRARWRRRCSTAGRNVYMLDGKNVLLGVDHDLWVDAAQSELVRRFGEVVHLLLNAGPDRRVDDQRHRPGRRDAPCRR